MSYYDDIVENKWLAILSESAKNILYFSISNNFKRVVSVEAKVLQENTGLNLNAIQDGIKELVAFQFFISNKKIKKRAKILLKKNSLEIKEMIFVLNSKVPKTNDRYLNILNHNIYKNLLISLVSKEVVKNSDIKMVQGKIKQLKDQKLNLYYKQFEFLLKAKKDRNKAFINIYNLIDFLENEKEDIEKELQNKKKMKIDYSKLNYYEKTVIKSFEQWTNNSFPPEDIDLLRDALKIAYPNMITSGMKRIVSNTKTNIDSFEYFYPLITKGVFGKKPHKKKPKKTKKGDGKNGERDFWEDYKDAR